MNAVPRRPNLDSPVHSRRTRPRRTRSRTRRAAVFFLAAAIAPASLGFTAQTRVEIARRSITLMPDALERQLRKHARALFEGVLEEYGPGEGRGEHAFDPGEADRRLELAINRLVSRVDEQAPMREVARELGRVAHAASDLAFALNTGPDDEREAVFYPTFTRYVETMLPKMRITFGGFASEPLARGDVRAFGRAIAEAARRDYDGIVRSYHPDGRAAMPQDFDERSVAFAAASLEVSLAVTSTARAWLYAWHRAHGDLTGAPLFGTSGPHAPFAAHAAADHDTEDDRSSSAVEETGR